MINFNSLPNNRPTNLPAPGPYYATVEAAEMRQGFDATKPPYLNITLALKDKYGKNCGKIYDILSESDKELVQYKLARFIIALGLENLGTFELTDLVRVIKNKQLIVDVKQEEATERYPAKAVVDVFKGSIYYPMRDAETVFQLNDAEKELPFDLVEPSDDLKINASDAVDVHATDLDDF